MFTAKELESLEKKIASVEKWRDEKLEEQEKQPLSEMPKLTVSLIKSKVCSHKFLRQKINHEYTDPRSRQRSATFDWESKNDQGREGQSQEES